MRASLEMLEKADEIAPDDADIHTNKGVMLLRLGRIDEALTELLIANKLRPHDVGIENNIRIARRLKEKESRTG